MKTFEKTERKIKKRESQTTTTIINSFYFYFFIQKNLRFVGEHIWKILVYIIIFRTFEKCQFFWSVSSRIWTEYGEIRNISPYSVECGKIQNRELRIQTLFTQCLYYSSFYSADYLRRSNESPTSKQIYTGFVDAVLRPKILDNKLGILTQILIAMDYYLFLQTYFQFKKIQKHLSRKVFCLPRTSKRIYKLRKFFFQAMLRCF